jgi:hypothetical protein
MEIIEKPPVAERDGKPDKESGKHKISADIHFLVPVMHT